MPGGPYQTLAIWHINFTPHTIAYACTCIPGLNSQFTLFRYEADDIETEDSHSDGYVDPTEAEQEGIHEVEQTTADKHSWIRQAMYMKDRTG